MSDDDGADYRVGRGRPPRHSRFRKGLSGNPNGRPRKPRTSAGIVEKVRDEPVRVTINGKVAVMTSFEAAVRQVHNKVIAGGKVADLERLLRLYDKYCPAPEPDRAAEAEAAGEAVVRRLFEFFDRTVPDDPPGPSPDFQTGEDEK